MEKLLRRFSQIVPYTAKQIEMRKNFHLTKNKFHFRHPKSTPDMKSQLTYLQQNNHPNFNISISGHYPFYKLR